LWNKSRLKKNTVNRIKAMDNKTDKRGTNNDLSSKLFVLTAGSDSLFSACVKVSFGNWVDFIYLVEVGLSVVLFMLIVVELVFELVIKLIDVFVVELAVELAVKLVMGSVVALVVDFVVELVGELVVGSIVGLVVE
jgi:hypothetical protein